MIAAVIVLDGHLEGARFAQFWQQVEALRELVNPGVLPGRLGPSEGNSCHVLDISIAFATLASSLLANAC